VEEDVRVKGFIRKDAYDKEKWRKLWGCKANPCFCRKNCLITPVIVVDSIVLVST